MRIIFALLFAVTISAYAFGITVKIENPRLEVSAKNNAGEDVMSAHAKLTVSGIKGKDFDLVAIVKDDTGEWHKDANGNTVKTHYKCNATYESSVWNNIEVWLKHSKLAPKPGKHAYEVYLYVYYNGEWYGGTKAGSYNQTGASRSSSSSSSSSRSGSSSSHTSSSSNSNKDTRKTITCSYCSGTGKTMCYGCSGLGYRQVLQSLPYYPYTMYTANVACGYCSSSGKVGCVACGGKGQYVINTYNNSNNYNSNSNNYNYNYNGSSSYGGSRNSSGGSSAYTTCRICGGGGVCTSCHGSGGEWRDTGYYVGSDTKSWISCPSCRGSKKCFNCHGTGRQ